MAFSIVALFAVVVSPAAIPIRAEGSTQAMGGVFTIVAYGTDAEKLHRAINASLNESRRLDALLSNYRPDSEWSLLNRWAASMPVRVSRESFLLISHCLEYSRQSEGTFDITVGPLMKAWGFFKNTGSIPDPACLRLAMNAVGWRNILLDPEKCTVRFAHPGTEIDPGGIGKGYAVDKMTGVLKSYGVVSALISAASSSIYALGSPPGENGWKITISGPDDSSEVVRLKDQSISTSGTKEKFFIAEGKRYSHIMDPRTGYPAMGMSSASVIAPATIDSEAWAKPYFILGAEWAAAHRKSNFQIFLCREMSPRSSCSWVL